MFIYRCFRADADERRSQFCSCISLYMLEPHVYKSVSIVPSTLFEARPFFILALLVLFLCSETLFDYDIFSVLSILCGDASTIFNLYFK